MKFKSVRTRTMVLMLPILVGTLMSLLLFSYFSTNSLINSQLDQIMNNKLDSISNDLNTKVTAHSKIPETLARSVEGISSNLTLEQYRTMLSHSVTSNPDTYGVGVFFDPYKYSAEKQFFSTYAYRDQGKVSTTEDYNDPSYNYPNQDWYKIAANTQASVVYSAPYYDEVSGVSMVTASAPIYDTERKLLGVVTGDIDLTSIQKLISSIKIGETGYTFLTDANGTYLSSPVADNIMKKKITEDSNPTLAQIGNQLLQNEQGKTEFIGDNGKNIVFFKKLKDTNWVLAVVISEQELFAPIKSLITSLLVISAIGIIVIIILIHVYSRYLTRQIHSVNEVSQAMAQGDFSRSLTVQSEDEFGQMSRNFNAMRENVQALLSKISASSHHVAATAEELTASAEQTSKATEQIAETVQEVAAGTDKQVRSVEESSRSIREMSHGIDQIAQNAQHVADTAQQAMEMAQDGDQSIRTAIQQMHSISDHINELSHTVKGLGDRSQEIGQIVAVISGISQQTNLLALNAAIEAARAGEHGRGFAVVADEVRKLAEQSSQSAQQISQLIGAIQLETSKAVSAMETSTQEVTSGIHVVNTAGVSFEQIQAYVNQVAQRITEVSESARKLSTNTQKVVQSTNLIAEMADTTASGTQNVSAASEEQLASMQEIASSAHSLSQMAEELHSLISTFKV
ncbi:methyl-accepting chemotaxis protein [Brevibacillus sp. SYSU BS000544]|uniref:methyl-accepting chemotaxis protein n=1 Tax=Brevibacillus sp. SYSU BS000544 TaxID=3416443 RepID=UPI003CE481FF